uniref:Uncharacterized protein n=1 Tax=Ditylenchus dipsaci TaxID=166011 RepID=A0A915CT82_9BILA
MSWVLHSIYTMFYYSSISYCMLVVPAMLLSLPIQVNGFVVAGSPLSSQLVAPAPPAAVASQPVAPVVDLPTQLTALQQQLQQIQLQLAGNPQAPQEDNRVDDDGLFNKNNKPAKQFNRRQVSFQPMRRMVSWQPMRKAAGVPTYSREQVMKAIEDQLTETLHAGEQLGVSANDILAHLRQRNMLLYQPFA